LGIETVREYLYVRYLQETTGEDYAELTRRVRAQDRLEAQQRTSPPSPYGRLYMVKDEKVKQFFREHPFAALRLMATEMLRQFAAPQEFFPQVFVGDLPNWGRGLGSLLSLTLWGCAALGGYTLWKQGNKAPALMTAGVLLFFPTHRLALAPRRCPTALPCRDGRRAVDGGGGCSIVARPFREAVKA
jgi:hypothetical protein